MHDFDDDPDHEHAAEFDSFAVGDTLDLTTVGIDIGSSTSHLMFSRLRLQRMGKYLSSRYVVIGREVLHRSPILLTPYRSDYTISAEALGDFIHKSYKKAGLVHDDIDTGAIILTGEAVKRSNARAIAELFAQEAGKFVCASAGHNLEAIMAGHGSGAVAMSHESHGTVLNVDVGGGTTKLAIIHGGAVRETAAISVGGRLVATDAKGQVIRIEPSARDLADQLGIELHLNEKLSEESQTRLAEALADCLMELINDAAPSELTKSLMVTPPLRTHEHIDAVVFSGGVSEYIYQREKRSFNDLAIALSDAIRKHIAAGEMPAPVQKPAEGIRATVIGASQFTVQVSGNTISISSPEMLPIHNIQVVYPRLRHSDDLKPEDMSTAIAKGFQRLDLKDGEQPVALAINWDGTPQFQLLRNLAEGIVTGMAKTLAAKQPLILVFTNDFGRLIGNIMREEFGVTSEVISIDGIDLKEFDYVDVGEMIFPARVVPVVVKSLVFPHVSHKKAELVES